MSERDFDPDRDPVQYVIQELVEEIEERAFMAGFQAALDAVAERELPQEEENITKSSMEEVVMNRLDEQRNEWEEKGVYDV